MFWKKKIRLIDLFKEEINRAERNWNQASLSWECEQRNSHPWAKFDALNSKTFFCFIPVEVSVYKLEHWNKKLILTNVTTRIGRSSLNSVIQSLTIPSERSVQRLHASSQFESFWWRENDVHKDFFPNLKWSWCHNRFRASQTHVKVHPLWDLSKSSSKPTFQHNLYKIYKTFRRQKLFSGPTFWVWMHTSALERAHLIIIERKYEHK